MANKNIKTLVTKLNKMHNLFSEIMDNGTLICNTQLYTELEKNPKLLAKFNNFAVLAEETNAALVSLINDIEK